MPGYTPESSLVRSLTPDLEQFYMLRTSFSVDVEDLVQETWVAAHSYRGSSSLRHFLFCVARRLLANWHRKRYRRPYTLLDDLDLGSDSALLTTQETSPGSRLQLLNEHRRLRAAVDALDHPYRETMKMYLEGLDSVEIAKRLGIPSNTVRSRLARGRTAIQKSLGRP